MGDFARYDGVLAVVLAEAVVWHIDVPFAMLSKEQKRGMLRNLTITRRLNVLLHLLSKKPLSTKLL